MEWYSTQMKVVNSLIENCFAIIELLATEAQSMRLSDLADRLELQRSGAHRVLTTLVGLGWVEQDDATDFYRLSLKLPAIGYRFMQAASLPDVLQPVLDRLARSSRELIRLAALVSENLTTVAHAQGAQGSLICRSRTFPVLPLHVSASGKVWLATLSREAALKRALEAGLGKPGSYGPREIKTVDEFMSELDRTAARGYGIALEEAEEAIGAVAAPIVTTSGQFVGSLAIVAPAFRLNEARLEELGAQAKASAAELALVWPLRSVAGSDSGEGDAA
ncbi:IclR family transcriptional regulator [Sinorhizobium sp. 7-81]|uniref:IclR family transcriptional regulator n=1 Tax=Sinorhizobium sp. 8-89 TaxID=3049089 RepID=UPI0024C2D5ED|nr:IclR family transcriptional regulator [Sinorhizobium sp. 8-89]MDK1493712.1 IclR family transcriptional regulator [Sinorhizobium sp. 8-89]